MRKFLVLLGKELKELLTMQMLAPFLVTVLVFAAMGNLIGEQGEQSGQEQAVGVVDLDATKASGALVDAIGEAGFRVVALGTEAEDDMAEALSAEELAVGLVVPAGFERGLQEGQQQDVQTYAVLENFSFLATRDAEQLSAVLSAVNEALSTQMIAAVSPASDPAALKSPVRPVEHVIVGDKESTTSAAEVMMFVSNQTTFIPIILFIVIIFAAQMIATTIANEKENKTLETLLAAPVSRTGLVGAKMVAASTVALLSAGAYMLGMWYYMKGMTEGLGGGVPGAAVDTATDAMAALGIALGTVDYVLLGLMLFFSILTALAIAVILGAFAESVRAVQSLLAPLMVMLMVPYFLTLFVDVSQLSTPLRVFVYAIPFSHAFLAAPNLFLGNTQAVLWGIAYLMVWCVALIIVAGRIFSTDRILTMKLDLRRKRRG
ncbi:MAG: ABC transporter permease [Coriobacteriia bacterium]|jgi:ABC-2 type transport system permease protein|nr:ABC transporter permease [Coriobacteriia bacterium]